MKKNCTRITLYYFLLTAIALAVLLLPLKPGDFFGSEGDWYSQHVGAAENIRQMMLDTGRLIPQFSAAGGGANMYDFAYYGLLRPDIIFSALIPDVEMKYIIAVYALLSAAASVNLCFYWLSRNGRHSPFSAAAASVLLISSTAFYQAHHQIMFINYMPFLILALLGIDRLVEKGKIGLLTAGLFLIYIHSYFYAAACLVVCLLYYLHRMQGQKLREGLSAAAKGAAAVFLSIGLAAVLLIPTGLDILSTHKDAGKFAAKSMEAAEPLKGLLYSPYSCGMTLISAVCLIWALKYKKSRFLAAAILISVSVPAVWLALNGFLYPREKILIPFLPIIVCLCGEMIEKFTGDSGGRKTIICILLLAPLSLSLMVNSKEDYLNANDDRQSHFSSSDIRMFADDRRYRFDALANSFVNSNLLADGGLYKTAMYSSVTNHLYADFYYNTMRNPISLRNRVVLMPNKNSFFNYFMGIRYIMAKETAVPPGYQVIFRRNGYVLAENPDVLPICYGTSRLLSQKDFDKLEFPDTLEALTSRAVVNGRTTTEFKSHIERSKLRSGQISIVEFPVDNPKGQEITMDIGGMRNVLSGASAPYPNKNHMFTYIMEGMRAEDVPDVSGIRTWSLEPKYLHHKDIDLPVQDGKSVPDGKTMFRGNMDMSRDGYFITSFPYRDGYEITVDGQAVSPELVNTVFLGFPLKSGHHEIKIAFEAPGFALGRAVSLISAALMLAVMIMEKKGRKRDENFAAIAAVPLFDDGRNDDID